MDRPEWTQWQVRVSWGFPPGGYSVGVPVDIPRTDRAIWLAELMAALNDARQILFELDLCGARPFGMGDLYQRIEAAKFEAELLTVSRSIRPRTGNDPIPTNLAPWTSETWDAR